MTIQSGLFTCNPSHKAQGAYKFATQPTTAPLSFGIYLFMRRK